MTESAAHNRHALAIQKFLTFSFDVRFDKQVTTIHRVAYYLHLRQVKTPLTQVHLTQIIAFLRQYVNWEFWPQVENAFYNFRDQSGDYNTFNEA